jgi:signal transduction histidine kinase
MHEPMAIREARRMLQVTLVVRAAMGVSLILVGSTLRPFGLEKFPWHDVLPGLYRVGPTLLVAILAFTPFLRRVLGRFALAVTLTLDLIGISVLAMPLLFYRQILVPDQPDMLIIESPRIAEALLVEPFLWLLVPLVLMAWAYGRRGALWGSTWAALLHIGTGFWVLEADLLGEYFFLRELARVALIFVVPSLVSALARRERGQVLELESAHSRLKRYAATIEQLAASRERNRLARELHDTLAHSLAALIVHLEALRTLLKHDPVAAEEATEKALGTARRGLEESRQAIQALRADPLEALGLVGAIRSALQDLQSISEVSADLTVAGRESDLTDEEAQALFRIAEEAIGNVRRHAGAQQVAVHLAFGLDRVDLSVADDGAGFNPDRVNADHYGLLGMRERAEMIGATLAVNTQPGGGTEILVSLVR